MANWVTPELCALAGSVVLERRCAADSPAAIGGVPGGSAASSALSLRPEAPEIAGLRPQLVCPGDVVSAEIGALRGRGILEREDGKLVATMCGVVEQVNKLLYIRPLKHRYAGSVGDVVVGRVVEVQAERWMIEIGTAMLATLHLGAANLPGNVLRRRTDEDAQKMRELFREGDLISAEVQKVDENGQLSLQTRNARYGKLQNGMLLSLPCVYVRRQAQHLVTLPQIGVMVVLGNNGWVWVCAPPKVAGSGRQETLNFSQMNVSYELVPAELRERICRVRNSLLALASQGLEVTPETILFAYDQSLARGLAAWELLDASRCASAGLADAVVGEAVLRTSGT